MCFKRARYSGRVEFYGHAESFIASASAICAVLLTSKELPALLAAVTWLRSHCGWAICFGSVFVMIVLDGFAVVIWRVYTFGICRIC